MDTRYLLCDLYNHNYMYNITYIIIILFTHVLCTSVCVRVCGCARACVHVYVRRLRRECFLSCYGCSNRLPMASTMHN